jgi:hypothetical protein
MNSRFNRMSEKYNFDGFTQFSSAMFGSRQAVELMVKVNMRLVGMRSVRLLSRRRGYSISVRVTRLDWLGVYDDEGEEYAA